MKKSKKWLVIGIVSLVLFAAAAVCSFLFILPMMQKNKYFDYIKKGDVKLAGDAQEIMDKLSDSDKKSAIEMTKDLIVKETNNYLSGKKDYNSLKNILITVENIKDCWGMSAECFAAANKVELEKIYDELVTLSNGSSEYNDKKAQFKEVFNISVENTDPESAESVIDYLSYYEQDVQLAYINSIKDMLETKLKATYDAYKAGSVSETQLTSEADIMIDVVYANYFNSGLAYDIKDELKVVKEIKDSISDIESTISNKDYNAAINKCKDAASKYGSNQYYAEFKSQVDDLQKKAYDEGLTYYKSKFDEFINAKDKDNAQALYDQIKDNFGSEFNIDEILGGMRPEWADMYIKLLDNYESVIKQCMATKTDMSKYISLIADDYEKPVDYLIADLDGDKTPEIVIMSDKLSHIFSYKDGQVVYIATTGILATTATQGTYVTAYVTSGKDEKGNDYASENYVEFSFAKSKIKVLSHAYGYADATGKSTYSVNGKDADRDKFIEVGQSIIDKAAGDFQVTGRLDEDYETVISNYKE